MKKDKYHSASSGPVHFPGRPTAWDIFLLIFLVLMTFTAPRLLLSGAGGNKKAGDVIEIHSVDGNTELSLKKEAVHVVNGPLGPAKIIVKDGYARMESAPCPLKICEAMGPIRNAGEIILCLPNKISVKVAGGKGLDAVSR